MDETIKIIITKCKIDILSGKVVSIPWLQRKYKLSYEGAKKIHDELKKFQKQNEPISGYFDSKETKKKVEKYVVLCDSNEYIIDADEVEVSPIGQLKFLFDKECVAIFNHSYWDTVQIYARECS